jgi:hypothetical protein
LEVVVRWNKAMRKKLCSTLDEKREVLVGQCYGGTSFKRRWKEFLDSHGIAQFHLGSYPNPNPKDVVLDNPWGLGTSLQIPKEVAEKFLVLGVP